MFRHDFPDCPGVQVAFLHSLIFELFEEVIIWNEGREDEAGLVPVERAEEQVDATGSHCEAAHDWLLGISRVEEDHGLDG